MACRPESEPVIGVPAAEPAAGGWLVVDTDEVERLAVAVRRIPGVWGVQVHPPSSLVLHAPSPQPASLRNLLLGGQVWRAPEEIPEKHPSHRRMRTLLAHLQTEPHSTENDGGGNGLVSPQGAHVFLAPPSSPGNYEQGRSISPQSYAPDLYGYHMSELLLGSIAVVVILPESTGAVDPDLETWTQDEVDHVHAQLAQGLAYLQAACKACDIAFTLHVAHQSSSPDVVGVVDIGHEAISRPFNDPEANLAILSALGISAADQFEGFRLLNNAARETYGTDWAVSVKIGRDVNDADGHWQGQGVFAASYLGGPYLALTLRNYGDSYSLWKSFLHELNHAFGALDEYQAAGLNPYPHTPTTVAGYYAVANAGSEFNDGNGVAGGAGEGNPACIMMRYGSIDYCAHTQGQLGWWDTDGNGTMDAFEGPASATLTLDCNAGLSGGGLAEINDNALYPLFPDYYRWLYRHRTGLGTIAGVEYRVNGLAWMEAAPTDGSYDTGGEGFAFFVPVSDGDYSVEVRARRGNEDGQVPIARASCTVTGSPYEDSLPFPAFEIHPAEGTTGTAFTLDAWPSSDLEDPRFTLEHRWDWQSDGVWDTGWLSQPMANVRFAVPGLYRVALEVRDGADNRASVQRTVRVHAPGDLSPRIALQTDGQVKGGDTAPTFSLSVTESSAPDGKPLQVRWDFHADGVWDTPFVSTLVTDVSFDILNLGSGQWQVAAEISAATGARAVDFLLLRAVAYNRTPTARLTAEALGNGHWRLDGSASSDPDQHTTWDGWLEYRWDFEGDGRFDTPYTTSALVEHEYPVAGKYRAQLEVRDRFRFVSRAQTTIDRSHPRPEGLSFSLEQGRWQVSWQGVADSVGYAIEIARDSRFTDFVYRERIAAPETRFSLPAAPDDAWFARVAAFTYDWIPSGWSETLTIEASGADVTPALRLAVHPALPHTNDELHVRIDDGGQVPASHVIRWYRDEKEVTALTGARIVPPERTTKHERWTFGLTPSGSEQETRAAAVTVQNTPPTLEAVVLRYRDDRLICTPQGWYDADGDPESSRFSWKRDGVALPTTDASLQSPRAGVHVCTVVPWDGEDEGAPVSSAPVGIGHVHREGGSGCSTTSMRKGWFPLLSLGLLVAAVRAHLRNRLSRKQG